MDTVINRCEGCGRVLHNKRAGAKCCDSTCRSRALRKRARAEQFRERLSKPNRETYDLLGSRYGVEGEKQQAIIRQFAAAYGQFAAESAIDLAARVMYSEYMAQGGIEHV